MEDVELIAIGILFAIALWLVESRCPLPARVPAGLGVTALTAGALYVLHLDIAHSAIDFAQADIGAFLGAGLMDTWAHAPRT